VDNHKRGPNNSGNKLDHERCTYPKARIFRDSKVASSADDTLSDARRFLSDTSLPKLFTPVISAGAYRLKRCLTSQVAVQGLALL